MVVLAGEAQWAEEVNQLRAPTIADTVRASAGIELKPKYRGRRAQDRRIHRLLLHAGRSRHAKLQPVQYRPFIGVIQRPSRDPPIKIFELVRVIVSVDFAVRNRELI